jgi:hypothetical protein
MRIRKMRKDKVKDGNSDSDYKDISVNLLSKSLKLFPSGSIKININNLPAAAINIENQGKKLSIDLTEPNLLFKLENGNNDELGIFDKLKIAKEFAQKLTDNGMTLSILRNGKEAITLGDEARPTLSRIITRSDDIQIDSVIQSSKLKNELESDENKS